MAVVLADRAVDRGGARLPAYATAMMLGVLAGTALGWLIMFVVGSIFFPSGLFAEKLRVNPRVVFTVGISVWLEWVTLGALATFVYADRREIRRMAAALKAVQDERLAQVRRQLEADLLAMQARVEPQFLFDTLGHIEETYETDAASAECLLDSLITFLRAAMPQVRETTSTLEQEIALAFAYVSIQSIRSGHSAHCEADVPDELRAARVPPMTIIPLLDQAVNLQSASGSSRGAVRIVAASGAARLQVSIHVANCCLATEKAPTTMAVLRERLSALYDSAAETSVTPLGGHAAQATLAIPLDVPNQRSGRATQPA